MGRGGGNRTHYNGQYSRDKYVQKQKISSTPIQCQICSKLGHTTIKYWYMMHPSYNCNSNALIATNSNTNFDWVLDTGATSYVTNDGTQLLNAQPYNDTQQVAIGKGDCLPIHQSSQGLFTMSKW